MRLYMASLAIILLTACSQAPDVSFEYGIASGDPTVSSVVLWTHVTPADPMVPEIRVHWVVAADRELSDVIADGDVLTSDVRSFTVKADATGLQPGTTYYYAFNVGGQISPVGRTRTLPTGDVDKLNLAVVSCSHYGFGYFNAYRAIADRDDVDLILHLGDYYYEYGPDGYGGKQGKALGRTPNPPHEIVTLNDYRLRHAQYRSDPDLQAMTAQHPMIVVWDDHETANNSYSAGAENHDDSSEGSWNARKAAAVQAYREWLPIRDTVPNDTSDSIYRSFNLGNLATLIMLDTRIIGRDKQLDYATDLEDNDLRGFVGKKLMDPNRTILGTTQENWLAAELKDSRDAGVAWQILGQQLLVGRTPMPQILDQVTPKEDTFWSANTVKLAQALADNHLPFNLDSWDGYPAARDRLRDSVLKNAEDVLVLSGDSHNGWAFNLLSEGLDHPWAVEVAGPGVTAPGMEGFFPVDPDYSRQQSLAASPELVWLNNTDRGYMLVELTPQAATTYWYMVDRVDSRDFALRCEKALMVAHTSGPGTGKLADAPCR